MRIAVCDDDSVYAKEIEKIVQVTLWGRHIESKTDLYCDSRKLYESDKRYDIAFLDIEMEPYNGLETAQKLKKTNEQIIIFFITSFDQYLDDAMVLNAFRYIKKPLNAKRLQLGIEKALRFVDNSTERRQKVFSDFFKSNCLYRDCRSLYESATSRRIIYVQQPNGFLV